MSKNNIIIALVVLCLVGTIWGSVKDKKNKNLERQLTAMKQQTTHGAAPAVDEGAAGNVQTVVEATGSEAEELKVQNKELLTRVATLKGSVDSQLEEIATLKQEAERADNSQVIETMQARLDAASHEMNKLEAALSGTRTKLEEKITALAAAEEAAAGFEDVKSSLANSVDAYSAKNQELSAETETLSQTIDSLENELEERTKGLAAGGEELARTKLNMNVLLSKIAAQNDSLAILEETRVVLEKELAAKFQTIEALQHQLNAQVVVDTAIAEEAQVEAAPAEEAAVPVEESHGEQAEEAPAH